MKPFLAALVAAAAVPAPVAAQQAGTAAQSASAPAEKKTCRTEMRTGSIMPGRRVCHTRAEWSAIDAAQNRTTRGFDDGRALGTPGGGG